MRSGLLLAIALAAAGCGITSHVRPIGRGRSAVDVGVGGPVANVLGGYKPVPLVTAGITYGAVERLDVHARIHLVTALFGTPGFDSGVTWLALPERGGLPALSTTARLYAFLGTRPGAGIRIFPEGRLDASWLFRDRILAYGGVTLFAELTRPHVAFAPHLGLGYTPAAGLTASLEVKWISPSVENAPMVVDYLGIGGQGALAAVLGVSWVFGRPPPGGGAP